MVVSDCLSRAHLDESRPEIPEYKKSTYILAVDYSSNFTEVSKLQPGETKAGVKLTNIVGLTMWADKS